MIMHFLASLLASSHRRCLFLVSLAISLGGVVTLVADEILWSVIMAARKVALEDSLDTGSISFLSIDRGTGHVRNHGVATTHGVLGVSERMVLGCGLREPHITAIAVKVARLESFGNIFLDDDGTTGCVDEPRA